MAYWGSHGRLRWAIKAVAGSAAWHLRHQGILHSPTPQAIPSAGAERGKLPQVQPQLLGVDGIPSGDPPPCFAAVSGLHREGLVQFFRHLNIGGSSKTMGMGASTGDFRLTEGDNSGWKQNRPDDPLRNEEQVRTGLRRNAAGVNPAWAGGEVHGRKSSQVFSRSAAPPAPAAAAGGSEPSRALVHHRRRLSSLASAPSAEQRFRGASPALTEVDRLSPRGCSHGTINQDRDSPPVEWCPTGYIAYVFRQDRGCQRPN